MDNGRRIICIDPGHGGTDSGAMGKQVAEKDVTLAVGTEVYYRLLNRISEYYPVMTRKANWNMPLSDRATLCGSVGSDIFISIHCNSYTSKTPYDVQVYHWKGSKEGKQLATAIFDRLSPIDGGVSKWSRVEENHNYYVLKHTTCPAALVELDFISNPQGEALLVDPKYQRECAEQIVAGIDSYFGIENDIRRSDTLITPRS